MAKTLDEAGVKRLIQEIKGANKNLNAPIPISTENTPESMAQNVKNIADYVEKAKAAGIDTTKSFRLTLEIDGYPVEGSYDIQYSYAYGLLITDDGFAFFYDIDVTTGEVFTPREIVTAHSMQKVTSDMLAKGARKPIILTPSTTEVDEETYQKLLSDDVDVVFKTEEGLYVPITIKNITDPDAITLDFSITSFDSAALDTFDSVVIDVLIRIVKNSPHKVTFPYNESSDLDVILQNSGYFTKSTLSPVLQEIDLRGTDAERKAKLDQFEADWKALTGASDLTGARFVGQITTPKGGYASVLFTYNIEISTFTGVTNLDDCNYRNHYSVYLNIEGSLTITPLFSHLEAITIRTGNTTDDKAANVAAIKAYVDNLTALGVDTTKGYIIPCKFNNSRNGFIMQEVAGNYAGFIKDAGTYYGGGFVSITTQGTYQPLEILATGGYNVLTTNSKYILGAINEINDLAKGYSTIFTPIELTTETAQNKTAIDARVAAFTAQGISLTNGCCIPVTYKGVYAGNISLINGDWYGLLVKNTNNPADNINIKLSADGTITEGNSVQ